MIWQRAEHVYREALRVMRAASLLTSEAGATGAAGDALREALGTEIDGSHASCRGPLPVLVPRARTPSSPPARPRALEAAGSPARAGEAARSSAVRTERVEAFVEEVKREYYGKFLGMEEGDVGGDVIGVSEGGRGAALLDGGGLSEKRTP